MMDSNYLQSLLIGIMVTGAIFVVLQNVFGSGARKALGIFAGAAGLLTTLWLQENPMALREYSAEIAVAAIGVVLALLAFARNSLKK